MSDSIPPDALLGNHIFDFEADPESFQLMQQDLAAAREEAKAQAGADQEADQSWVGPDGSIDPVAAGEIYQLIRLLAEDDVLNLAKRYSPAAWLWYLRRLPLFFFDFEDSLGSAHRTSDLAEIMTALPQAHAPTEPESLKSLRYRLDRDVTVDLLRLCGKIHVLRRIHQGIRMAGIEVAFRYVPGDLPAHSPTESQQQAMRSYGRRSDKRLLFSMRAGTPLGELGNHPDAILVAVKDFAGRRQIPSEAFDNDVDQFFPAQKRELSLVLRPVRNNKAVEVSTKFTLLDDISLTDLRLFSTEQLDTDAQAEAAQLLMLLRLARKMIIVDNPAYGVFQAARTGYINERVGQFLELLDSSFDELAGVAHRLVPEAPLPANAEDLLAELEAMTGSSWPLVHGPVIRPVAGSLMVDLFAATRRLDRVISFKKDAPEKLTKQRSKHFEDRVQRIIDNSPCKAVPVKLKDLRRRKSLKKADGTPLTDIDAIGVRGDTVLIVECKSRIETDNLFLGTYNTARNGAERLEREVRKARETEQYLRENPKHPKGSYDFSDFERLVVVVCTPEPVYVELAMVRNAGLEVAELLSTQEVLSGLLAAVSVSELGEWLHSPSYATGRADAK